MRWAILLLLPLFLACHSEGERFIDQFAAQLSQASSTMAEGEGTPEERSSRALKSLEEDAVRMRILESRLDDIVRTLSERQRRKLADYARTRLAEVAAAAERQ